MFNIKHPPSVCFHQKHYTFLGGAFPGKRLIFRRFSAFLGEIFIFGVPLSLIMDFAAITAISEYVHIDAYPSVDAFPIVDIAQRFGVILLILLRYIYTVKTHAYCSRASVQTKSFGQNDFVCIYFLHDIEA